MLEIFDKKNVLSIFLVSLSCFYQRLTFTGFYPYLPDQIIDTSVIDQRLRINWHWGYSLRKFWRKRKFWLCYFGRLCELAKTGLAMKQHLLYDTIVLWNAREEIWWKGELSEQGKRKYGRSKIKDCLFSKQSCFAAVPSLPDCNWVWIILRPTKHINCLHLSCNGNYTKIHMFLVFTIESSVLQISRDYRLFWLNVERSSTSVLS